MKNLADPANITFVSRPTFLLSRSFGHFWIGQSISTLGSQVTAFAVPLLAALSLHANAQQMGLLRAAEFAPFLFLTLPAGVLMISSNLIRAVIIVCVPLAIALGWARLEVLYLVMLLMGSFKVIFEGVAVATSIAEAFSSKLRSFQAPWETNSVFKRARNLWIRGLGSSLRQAAATVQAAALSVK